MKKRKQNSQASAEPSPLTTPSSTTFQLHVVRECSRMDLQHEGGPQLSRPGLAFSPPSITDLSVCLDQSIFNTKEDPNYLAQDMPFTAINHGPLCLKGSRTAKHLRNLRFNTPLNFGARVSRACVASKIKGRSQLPHPRHALSPPSIKDLFVCLDQSIFNAKEDPNYLAQERCAERAARHSFQNRAWPWRS